ncbi:MAG: glycosyltransferase family 39 protein [Phycisphaerae bacterium]|nr:glycosyltransferase family 39 protein [Phycisphaerae bacterium]
MGSLGQRPLSAPAQGEPASVWFLVLFVFATVMMFWGLDAGPPLSDHEAIVAQIACQTRQTGNWLIPHFNNVPFIRKPPLQPWLVAVASYLVDPPGQQPAVSVLAARLPSAMAGILTVLVVYALGRSMFPPRVALVAGGIMACCGGTLFYAHNAQTEMLLTFFVALCMLCFYRATLRPEARRRYLFAFYLALALGMLAKAPMPLALVGLTLFLYWFVTIPIAAATSQTAQHGPIRSILPGLLKQRIFRLRELWLIPGVLLFLLVFLPWPAYIVMKVEHALPLWRTEYLDRYTGAMEDDVKPLWYYLPLVFALTIPFCLSIPDAIAAPFRRVYRADRAGLLFALTWAVVQVAFISTSAFKRPHYMLPALPALCLLLAPVIDRLFLRAVLFDRKRVTSAAIAIFTATLVGAPIAAYFAGRDKPVVAWAAFNAIAILIVGVGLAAYLFRSGRRRASLITIYVMPLLVFAWLWSALARGGFETEEVRFAERLRALSLPADAKITWAVGRPDARVCYYSGLPVQPLYTPMEMAARRRGRTEVPQDILIEGATRIINRLESTTPEYFIFEAGKLDMFGSLVRSDRAFRNDYAEILRVQCDPGNPREDLIVITNKWNTLRAAQAKDVQTHGGATDAPPESTDVVPSTIRTSARAY